MYHSVTFGEKNSWTDWHLVASSRPVISPPPVKTQYVEIPGADGSIDLTDALAGRPAYGDREGSIDFVVLNDYNLDNYDYNWIDVYTSIMQYLHGRRMTMVLEDDPLYYYEGRFSVNSWKSDQNNSTITIDYHVSPYKYRITTQITAGDLERGAFRYQNDASPVVIKEENTAQAKQYNLRSVSVKPYSAGDAIRLDNRYVFDIALYSGTAARPVPKKYVISQVMFGNRYEFTDSGFYRITMRYPVLANRPVDDGDIPDAAAAIHYYTGGVL